MKVAPTLEGGLRLDAEDAEDWEILRCIDIDAHSRDSDLADSMGGLIGEEADGDDWREYVVPDLREAFEDELGGVCAAIESAAHKADDGVGSLWITPADAFAWYSALNQARLALEDIYRFGPTDHVDPGPMAEDARDAYLRSKFYVAIQSLLLEYAMK